MKSGLVPIVAERKIRVVGEGDEKHAMNSLGRGIYV